MDDRGEEHGYYPGHYDYDGNPNYPPIHLAEKKRNTRSEHHSQDQNESQNSGSMGQPRPGPPINQQRINNHEGMSHPSPHQHQQNSRFQSNQSSNMPPSELQINDQQIQRNSNLPKNQFNNPNQNIQGQSGVNRQDPYNNQQGINPNSNSNVSRGYNPNSNHPQNPAFQPNQNSQQGPRNNRGPEQTQNQNQNQIQNINQIPESENMGIGENQGEFLTPAQESILKKFNTLDRGTYYLNQKNKTVHFLVEGTNDIIGWHDDYLINGYLLHGLVLKINTLTSRIFLFVETEHEIYKTFVNFTNNKLSWSSQLLNEIQILSITHTEKVEIYDNFEEGFEGFISYIVTEESKLTASSWPASIQGWLELQRNLVLYEPTSIRKIYLDNLYNWLEKPESSEFNGKRIACIINPDIPGQTIKFSKRLTFALEKKCVVGSISTQYGVYTLMAEQVQDMKRFSQLVEKALDIAEELGGYVMITNLRRTFDYNGKTVLYLPGDPTLKILTYEGTITFSNKSKKSLALN
jgi:hypothetical protein